MTQYSDPSYHNQSKSSIGYGNWIGINAFLLIIAGMVLIGDGHPIFGVILFIIGIVEMTEV